MTTFSSLRQILHGASPTSRRRGCRTHWRLLNESGVRMLLEEMERKDHHGRFVHRIHPETMYLVRSRLQEFQQDRHGNERLHDQRTYREDRYQEEEAAGEQSVRPPSRRLQWGAQYLTLPDGRRARQLNCAGTLALPLCGMIAPVQVADIVPKPTTGTWRKCPHCFGFHARLVSSSSRAHGTHDTPIEAHTSRTVEHAVIHCPKCQASSLDVRTQGLIELHCLICGWLGELHSTQLTEEEVAHNAIVLAGASIRYVDEETHDQDEPEDGLVDWESQREDTGDEPTSEEQLLTRLGDLWACAAYRGVREGLLEATLLRQRTDEEIQLLWSVTLVFLENCRELSRDGQRQFVACLVALSREQLEEYLSEWWDPETETLAEILPDIQPKLNRYRQACRKTLQRFRSRTAGIRILAPKFQLKPQVFEAAVAGA